jgi:hypothetical protein
MATTFVNPAPLNTESPSYDYQKQTQKEEGNRVSVTVLEQERVFIENWKPLFYLLVNSRDFRKLLLDAISIARGISTPMYTEEQKQNFKEGQVKGITELTEEEWVRLQDDIQRVLTVLAKDSNFRKGTERFFNLLDSYQKCVENIPLEKFSVEESHMFKAIAETEELVASFSGKDTLGRFKFYLRSLMTQVQENQTLRNYFNELKYFILQTRDEEVIPSKEVIEKSRDLVQRGRFLLNQFKGDNDLELFLRSADEIMQNFKNDEFLKLLRNQAGIVQSDLSYVDSEGIVQVDRDMLSKLQTVLLPVLTDSLQSIPLPRIHTADSSREFWLDNIILSSYNINPENIRVHLETDSEVNLLDSHLKATHTYLVIQLDPLLTELKDLEFYYRKKGILEMEDSGRVTFRIKGRGAKLSLIYNVLQDPKDKVPRLMYGNASFDIHEMDIDFDTSTLKHDVLIPMLTILFKTQIKHQIEHQVENNLTTFVNKLGDMLTSAVAEVNRPFLTGFEAKNAVKSSITENRREKLE